MNDYYTALQVMLVFQGIFLFLLFCIIQIGMSEVDWV